MKIKRALIFCVVCLILWAAWGSRANAEEDTEDDNNFYYAWSDIDSNGQPKLVILRQADEEDSYVSLLKLERVGGLDICTFAVRASEWEQYHVMMTGEWENAAIEFQHLVIPATKGSMTWTLLNISQVDINFDGKEDLLIHESFSSGSGGNSGTNYRAVVWEESTEEFVTDMSADEMEALYPDLNFWIKG